MPQTKEPASSVVPYLFYDDVERAAGFLENAFGFARTFVSPAPEGGLAHAQLALGSGRVMLGQTGRGLRLVKSAGALDALHAGVYVFVDEVDAHCAKARAAGARVLLEPADQPWGDRMYCAVDPEGQFWMFAKHLTKAWVRQVGAEDP
jgi:uncharacterized glyoxalase superfamily protein PhnB